MILHAFLLLLVSTTHDQRNSFQLMTSPAFQDFARLADATCPARRLRFLTPADLDYKQEQFEERLAAQARARLSAIDKGEEGCTNQDGGLSCPAQHKLDAMIELDLLRSFTAFACSTPG